MNTTRWSITINFIGRDLLTMSLIIGLLTGLQPSAVVPAAGTAGLTSPPVAAKDGMAQVYVPAGEFLMGSTSADIDKVMQACSDCSRDGFKGEMPQHRVYLDAFWIDKTEVTNAMFAKFVAATGYETVAEKAGGGIVFNLLSRDWKMSKDANWRHPRGSATDIQGLDDHPVVHISYHDAQAYCQWAGRRLPTEAEWEKAARGPDGRMYPWGNQPPAGNLLNFADRNSYVPVADLDEDDGYPFTAPVGSYPDGASPYGVMDMAGNVWERVAGWYSDTYYANSPARNPAGPSSGDYVMIRGGSWSRQARYVRAAARYRYLQANRSSGLGFRCAASVSTSMPTLTPVPPTFTPTALPPRPLAETSMADFAVTDFGAVHAPVNGDANEHLIFGNMSVTTPGANLPYELAVFIGRWEGYSYAPPVKKDWKFVLVVQEITAQGGKALFWGGTNLQYPRWIKEIQFRVVSGDTPAIEWEYSDDDGQQLFTFAYERGKNLLQGWQKLPADHHAIGPIELSRGQSFYVYKDYVRYLADKRIYPRGYRDKIFPVFYGQGYLLYLPEGYEANPQQTWPLLIFLHGAGDRGDNLFLLAKASPFMMIREQGPLPFIIVAPLLSISEFYGSFPDNYLKGVLEEVLADYRVDQQRIYVTGLSMGGEATYRFALQQPNRFAAIAPLAAYLSSSPDMASIKDVPVWAIHDAEDPIIPLAVGQRPVDALKHVGGNVRFSVLEHHDHDVWTDTYSNPQFYDWLLQYKRP